MVLRAYLSFDIPNIFAFSQFAQKCQYKTLLKFLKILMWCCHSQKICLINLVTLTLISFI